MCLIIHRPKNVTIPPAWLENGQHQNPHGWGIMASDGSKLQIAKGMTRKGFTKAINRFKNREIFIHFRNATHGTIDIENCHPFTIIDNQFAIMHNGVINIDTSECNDRSDTWHYANRIIAPILAQDPASISRFSFADAIGHQIGIGNKIVILRADGRHAIVNQDQGTELSGCWLSNTWSISTPWQAPSYTLHQLGRLKRAELVEVCTWEPEAVADAILDDYGPFTAFRDYR